MRQAMAAAEVGDDVFGEDPTVQRLQARVAELLGKEAALFVPSGTMSNQVGLRVHCRPGDEMICEAQCHLYYYEQGGFAQLSGIAARTVDGCQGLFDVEQVAGLLRPADQHFVRTRLLCLENTHNRGGGRIQPYDLIERLCGWAHQHGLRTHLDGARLLNAVVATGIPAARWAAPFDTVSICFSKGLGAPVGSALAGPRDLIAEGLRHRKVLGGGMRQAGVIAAAALYALDHHIDRLADDHAHARRLADGVHPIAGLRLEPEQIDTNIVYIAIDPRLGTAADLAGRLKQHDVLFLPTGPQTLRAVTHLDVSAADVDSALATLRRICQP